MVSSITAFSISQMRVELISLRLAHLRFDRMRMNLREGQVEGGIDAVSVQGTGCFGRADRKTTREQMLPHFNVTGSQLAPCHQRNFSHSLNRRSFNYQIHLIKSEILRLLAEILLLNWFWWLRPGPRSSTASRWPPCRLAMSMTIAF